MREGKHIMYDLKEEVRSPEFLGNGYLCIRLNFQSKTINTKEKKNLISLGEMVKSGWSSTNSTNSPKAVHLNLKPAFPHKCLRFSHKKMQRTYTSTLTSILIYTPLEVVPSLAIVIKLIHRNQDNILTNFSEGSTCVYQIPFNTTGQNCN